MELNQLLEGSNNFKTVQADAARLSSKWAKSGLLEGYSNETEKNNMAMILENQAKQIVSEQSANSGAGSASFTAGQGSQWAGVALPLVRKVFAQIASKDFVSVQPMNLPSGLVFYLDFKYGSDSNGFSTGDNMYGNVSTADAKMTVDEDVSGGLYGAGRFGYSMNEVTGALDGTANTGATGSANSASVGYDADLDPAEFFTVAVDLSNTGFDAEGVRAFRILSGSTDITSNPEFTTVAVNAVTFVITGSVFPDVPDDGAVIGSIQFQVQPTDNDRGDFEDNPKKVKPPNLVPLQGQKGFYKWILQQLP